MRYPMLKLIKSPNRHYCYDANENQIVPISEQLFQYIHFCQAGGELEEPAVTDDVYSELHDLNEKGLLTNRSNVETIHHPYTPYMPSILSRGLNHITLQVTQNCNLRCKYCVYSDNNGNYNRHHTPEKMKWHTAKNAIDFLAERSVDCRDISIGFYGGEPLLEFQLVKNALSMQSSNSQEKTCNLI